MEECGRAADTWSEDTTATTDTWSGGATAASDEEHSESQSDSGDANTSEFREDQSETGDEDSSAGVGEDGRAEPTCSLQHLLGLAAAGDGSVYDAQSARASARLGHTEYAAEVENVLRAGEGAKPCFRPDRLMQDPAWAPAAYKELNRFMKYEVFGEVETSPAYLMVVLKGGGFWRAQRQNKARRAWTAAGSYQGCTSARTTD